MFLYFGYGSNMSLTSLRAKGVEPLAWQRAVLPGWRLRFNVQHFFRHEGGVGNIEYTGDAADRVWGLLHRCHDEALPLLDAAEACGHGYDRIRVTVEGEEGAATALTYVGIGDFLQEDCRPTRRYLNILLAGASQAGLPADYIEALRRQPLHPPPDYPPFVAPAGDFPHFDERSLAARPLYTALQGAVFDMSVAPPRHEFLKAYFGGRDMTLFHLRRLDSSDGRESLDDIRQGRLTPAQRHYLNAYLHEYNADYRYVGCFDYG